MPSIAEDLSACRRQLAAEVETAIHKFQRQTGFSVSSFDITHHYTGMVLDANETKVISVNINIKEKE